MTDAEVLGLYGWKLICEAPLTIEDKEGGRATLSVASRILKEHRTRAIKEGKIKKPRKSTPLPVCFVCGKPIKGTPKYYMKMVTLPQHRECIVPPPRG